MLQIGSDRFSISVDCFCAKRRIQVGDFVLDLSPLVCCQIARWRVVLNAFVARFNIAVYRVSQNKPGEWKLKKRTSNLKN